MYHMHKRIEFREYIRKTTSKIDTVAWGVSGPTVPIHEKNIVQKSHATVPLRAEAALQRLALCKLLVSLTLGNRNQGHIRMDSLVLAKTQ